MVMHTSSFDEARARVEWRHRQLLACLDLARCHGERVVQHRKQRREADVYGNRHVGPHQCRILGRDATRKCLCDVGAIARAADSSCQHIDHLPQQRPCGGAVRGQQVEQRSRGSNVCQQFGRKVGPDTRGDSRLPTQFAGTLQQTRVDDIVDARGSECLHIAHGDVHFLFVLGVQLARCFYATHATSVRCSRTTMRAVRYAIDALWLGGVLFALAYVLGRPVPAPPSLHTHDDLLLLYNCTSDVLEDNPVRDRVLCAGLGQELLQTTDYFLQLPRHAKRLWLRERSGTVREYRDARVQSHPQPWLMTSLVPIPRYGMSSSREAVPPVLVQQGSDTATQTVVTGAMAACVLMATLPGWPV